MNYTKPAIAVSGSAVREIQGMNKPPINHLDSDNDGTYTTVGAYEADE